MYSGLLVLWIFVWERVYIIFGVVKRYIQQWRDLPSPPSLLFIFFLSWLPEVQTVLKVNKTPLVSHWEHMSGEKQREAWVLRVFCLLIQHCEMVRCSLMSQYIHHCLCCLSSLLTTPPPNTQTRRLIFLIRSFALSCFLRTFLAQKVFFTSIPPQ